MTRLQRATPQLSRSHVWPHHGDGEEGVLKMLVVLMEMAIERTLYRGDLMLAPGQKKRVSTQTWSSSAKGEARRERDQTSVCAVDTELCVVAVSVEFSCVMPTSSP